MRVVGSLGSLMGMVVLLLALPARGVEPMVVRHNLFADANNKTLNYKGEVLALILEKSKAKYGPYVMLPGSQQAWSQRRAYNELEHGDLDLMTSQTSIAREKSSLPIRYCLYKGLLGIRIGMGAPAIVEKMNRVTSREQLNQVKLGQVSDWPDYAIQTAAGLQVTSLTSVESSLPRLLLGTFELLPLGVVEVEPIAKRYNLKTVSTWAIAYPTAYYFFVNRKRPELAQRLEYGFEQAIKDHSFDRLFARRIEPLIASSKLENRQLFRIANPLLPPETPLHRKELWHPLIAGGL
ncbi:MAG: hypothetical protein WAW73_13780 [Rhodoferax sp.]